MVKGFGTINYGRDRPRVCKKVIREYSIGEKDRVEIVTKRSTREGLPSFTQFRKTQNVWEREGEVEAG